jgi:hypothetical protein
MCSRLPQRVPSCGDRPASLGPKQNQIDDTRLARRRFYHFPRRHSVKSLVRYGVNADVCLNSTRLATCLAKPDAWSTFKCPRSH